VGQLGSTKLLSCPDTCPSAVAANNMRGSPKLLMVTLLSKSSVPFGSGCPQYTKRKLVTLSIISSDMPERTAEARADRIKEQLRQLLFARV